VPVMVFAQQGRIADAVEQAHGCWKGQMKPASPGPASTAGSPALPRHANVGTLLRWRLSCGACCKGSFGAPWCWYTPGPGAAGVVSLEDRRSMLQRLAAFLPQPQCLPATLPNRPALATQGFLARSAGGIEKRLCSVAIRHGLPG